MSDKPATTPCFDSAFRAQFAELLRLRRDVRHFRPDPVPENLLQDCLSLAHLAPSVGYSQPWRFVRVQSPARLARVIASFERANAQALAATAEEDRALYARLKLASLKDAPVQLAVFCDEGARTGRGLGQRTMPETRAYSVVCAIHTLWLALRAHGLGMGWLSIIEPQEVMAACEAPPQWRFIAWLSIGWPADEALSDTPELERAGWERRQPLSALLKTI